MALAVGVARQTVYTWKALFDEGGIDALRAVPERGRPVQLEQAQLEEVGTDLLQSRISAQSNVMRMLSNAFH